MAVFSRDDKTSDTGFSGKEITVVASSSEIIGDLKIEGNLKVEGKVSGNIFCNCGVVIEENGCGEGKIVARKITVKGKYNGILEADFIELIGESIVRGEINSNRILMKEGVVFEGTSKFREAFLTDKNIILELENKK